MKREIRKITLIAPPSRALSPRPPLGLMYVASSLRELIPDLEVSIIDIKSDAPPDAVYAETVRRLEADPPDLAGLGCLSTEVAEVRLLAGRIKAIDPGIVTVAGGIHPTLYPDYFFKEKSGLDYAVLGEGEDVMTALVRALRAGEDPAGVEGLAFRRDGEWIHTPRRGPIRDIDQLPFPAYDLVDMAYYTRPSEWVIRGVPVSGFWIFTSRGCPYACKFCVNKNLSGRMVRLRSARNVVDELEYLARTYLIDGFFVYDDAFGLKEQRVFEICDEMIRRRLNLVWGCQSRVNLLSEAAIRQMRRAGCVQLEFGVESGSPRILKAMKKQTTVDQVRRAFALCDRYKVRKLANFMVNYPGETMEDVRASMDLAEEIGANISLFNVTTLFPGSDLFYDFEGEIPEGDLVQFASQGDFDAVLRLIEKKYRLAAHDVPLADLLEEIARRFPVRNKISLRADWKYLIQMWRLFSFALDPKYWRVLLKTKRKKDYFDLFLFLAGKLLKRR